MQQMAEIPRALGFTDNQIQDALAVSTVGEEGNVINPFSAMGISGQSSCSRLRCSSPPSADTFDTSVSTDHDYVEMLQGIALEKEGKRGLEVVQGNEREGKRARFQEGKFEGITITQVLHADSPLQLQSTSRRLQLEDRGSAKREGGEPWDCTVLA
jgi:hypothetical protein